MLLFIWVWMKGERKSSHCWFKLCSQNTSRQINGFITVWLPPLQESQWVITKPEDLPWQTADTWVRPRVKSFWLLLLNWQTSFNGKNSGNPEERLLGKWWICYLHDLGTGHELTNTCGSVIQRSNQNKEKTRLFEFGVCQYTIHSLELHIFSEICHDFGYIFNNN